MVSPGLEEVAAGELRKLGLGNVRVIPGGVEFHGSLADAARANLWLRTATRVLVRLATFRAPGRRELAAGAARVPWREWLPAGAALAVEVTCRKSRLYHSGLVEEVVREAVGAETPAEGERETATLFVRLFADTCTLSLDTSGERLHRRGYREETSRAPLRETLAAGLLLLCGYDGSEAFVDPMCGSGTLPVEAALIASGRAPGLVRTFALERCPRLPRGTFERLREEARAAERPAQAPILGADLHGGALAAARRNAERAGVLELLRLERCDVARLAAPAGRGLLVTNPPYGRRVGQGAGESAATLRRLGEALAGEFRRWRRAVLLPPAMRRHLHLSAAQSWRLDNGGLPVELVALRGEEG